MDQLAAANFNVVYVDVWRYGYPYYRSPLFYDLTGLWTDPNLSAGRDILAEMIAEGHRAGLEVDAWFEAGFAACTGNNNDLYQLHPEWFARKQNGEQVFISNGGIQYNWLSHCNEDAQHFLISLAMEVAKKYDIDGIEFDRVRYPELDCGYDSATVSLYKSEHAGLEPPANSADANWMRWRADKLTAFVNVLYDSIKSVNASVTVSNAPLPWGYEQFCQDWPPWVNNGYLDIASTQMYYTTNSLFTWRLDREMAFVTDKSKLIPGISTVADGNITPASELIAMIKTIRDRGLHGNVIWYHSNLLADNTYTSALTGDVYSEKAELPYRADNWRFPAMITNESDSLSGRSDNWTEYTAIPGYDGKCLYTNSDSADWIDYQTDIPAAGWYEVYTFVVRHWNGHKSAPYEVRHQYGVDTVYVDQSLEANGRWYKLGDYYYEQGKRTIVRLSDDGLGTGILFADAIMVLESKRSFKSITSVKTVSPAGPAASFELLPAYPNPFNATTTINFILFREDDIQVEIYNILGQRVDMISRSHLAAGNQHIRWRADRLSSGIYYYSVRSDQDVAFGKLVLVR